MNSRAALRHKLNADSRARRECLQDYQQALLEEASQRVTSFLEDFCATIVAGLGMVSSTQERVQLQDLQAALYNRTLYQQHWQVMLSLPKALSGTFDLDIADHHLMCVLKTCSHYRSDDPQLATVRGVVTSPCPQHHFRRR